MSADDQQPRHEERINERREDRHHDRGREARESRGVSRSISENPIVALTTAIIVSVLGTGAVTTAVQSKSNPGASSVQIEALTGKVEALTGKVEALAGDVRSLRESDLGARMRRVEEFMVQQQEWRKLIDARASQK